MSSKVRDGNTAITEVVSAVHHHHGASGELLALLVGGLALTLNINFWKSATDSRRKPAVQMATPAASVQSHAAVCSAEKVRRVGRRVTNTQIPCRGHMSRRGRGGGGGVQEKSRRARALQ